MGESFNMREKLKHFFIPCEENGFKPNFLERISVGVMLVLILLSFATANIQALLWIGSDWMVSTILPAVIVDLTNEERTTEHIGTLVRNPLLDSAAQLKADDMAKNEYFAHYSPAGISPWYWFDKVAYNFVGAGENLAVHFTDSDEVVKAWMNSPGHRANILNGSFTEIGIGTAKGEYKGFPTVFVVQLFGTPAAAQVARATTPSTAPDISVETISTTQPEPSTETQVAPASLQTIPSPEPTSTPNSTESLLMTNTRTETTNVPEMVISNEVTTPVLAEEESVVLYSDLATTTRPGIPATITQTPENPTSILGTQANTLERTVTQPGLWLQILYGILALFVIVGLILSVVIEWRRQHPMQIAYAGGLLAVMAILFYVHIALTSGVTII